MLGVPVPEHLGIHLSHEGIVVDFDATRDRMEDPRVEGGRQPSDVVSVIARLDRGDLFGKVATVERRQELEHDRHRLMVAVPPIKRRVLERMLGQPVEAGMEVDEEVEIVGLGHVRPFLPGIPEDLEIPTFLESRFPEGMMGLELGVQAVAPPDDRHGSRHETPLQRPKPDSWIAEPVSIFSPWRASQNWVSPEWRWMSSKAATAPGARSGR
jgi:hypothetical protein